VDGSTPVLSSAELPFVVSPPGGLELVLQLAQRAAEHWRLPEPQLWRLGMNAIFTAGDVLLRVSRPTAVPEQAVWLAGELARRGIRVPHLVHEVPLVIGEYAVFAIDPVETVGPIDWHEAGEMIAAVHAIDPASVLGRYPTPFCGDFPWWSFESLMTQVAGHVDDSAGRGLRAAIGRGLPLLDSQRNQSLSVCHGDVHPGNVIQSAEGVVLLDWDLLCLGPPAWDHAPMMTWAERWGGSPGEYEAFAAGYATSLRGQPLAEAIAELRLVAATLMRVRAAMSNPDAAAEAEVRLRYWRGEVDAPAWHAQ
jgi:hypothetical protein